MHFYIRRISLTKEPKNYQQPHHTANSIRYKPHHAANLIINKPHHAANLIINKPHHAANSISHKPYTVHCKRQTP